MIFKLIFFLCLVAACLSENRKISMFINPGCGDKCQDDTNVLIHVKADGPNDTLHHIWDFTNKPCVIYALTALNTELMINWTSFLDNKNESIQFSTPLFYMYSFIIDKVIEFNDVNDTGIYNSKINNSSYSVVYTTNFKWKLEKKHVETDKHGYVVLKSIHDSHSHHFKKGSISFRLSAFGSEEYSDFQPHLLHTTNATQIDIQLDGLPTTYNYKSRFALGLVLVTNDPANTTVSQNIKKSFDDEHSPGIFTTSEIKAHFGYLKWRNVAYTSSSQQMTNSTAVNSFMDDFSDYATFDNTAFSSLFGSNLSSKLSKRVYISFGKPGDSFYSLNSFISWSFLGGIGAPADEGFSLLVLLIVGLGLGIPALLIIIGAFSIAIKRISRREQDIVFAEN